MGPATWPKCAPELAPGSVLVSTDLVFDGRRGWYRETDPTSPIEPYGRSKVVAEHAVLERGGMVARTSLIYGFAPLDPRTAGLVVGPLSEVRAHRSSSMSIVARLTLWIWPTRCSNSRPATSLAYSTWPALSA